MVIEAQRRAVESHEAETLEKFLPLTWKRAKDSNLPEWELGQAQVLPIPMGMVLARLLEQDNQIKGEKSEKWRRFSSREVRGEKAGRGVLHRGSSNRSAGAETWAEDLETFLGVLGTQPCLEAPAESLDPALLGFKVDKDKDGPAG